MALIRMPEPKNPFVSMIRVGMGALSFGLLFSTLIVFNFIQLLTLLIWVFSKRGFVRANREIADLWWSWCVLWAEKLYGIQVVEFGEELPHKENALVIPNHQGMSDIPSIFFVARRKERLGDCKWFVKDVLKYAPGPGWGMLFLNCIFIKRNWTNDKKLIHDAFDRVLTREIPLWLVNFTEGTRITSSKLRSSQKWAKKQGIKPTSNVLLPRTKGFVASIQALRGHLDAVYDFTIGYDGGVPTLWQWCKGLPDRVQIFTRRFSIESLPESAEELADWLMKRTYEKDELLEYYYNTGSFEGFTAPWFFRGKK